MNEEVAVLVGQRKGHIWHARLRQRRMGGPASVEFDWAWVLEREEHQGDVVGFYHTHPAGQTAPSERDVRTMRAWVCCFGKPLLCLIESGTTLAAYVFATDEAVPEKQMSRKPPVSLDISGDFGTFVFLELSEGGGQPLLEVQRFRRDIVVGVEERA